MVFEPRCLGDTLIYIIITTTFPMEKKLTRKGFLALVFGGIAALVVSQLPSKVFARKGEDVGYGNSAYGGN